MNQWIGQIGTPVEVELLEEAALAMAQSTIQNAVNEAGISKADLARKMERPRSYVSLMLSGRHNLTIKTMSRALAACGFEIRFQHAPIVWNWRSKVVAQPEEQQPAHAGTTIPVAEQAAGIVVSARPLQVGV